MDEAFSTTHLSTALIKTHRLIAWQNTHTDWRWDKQHQRRRGLPTASQELQVSFTTKPVNSWPLGVYLFNHHIILKESLFKGHKPSTKQYQLWPKTTRRHRTEKSFKLLTHNKDVKTLTYLNTRVRAHTHIHTHTLLVLHPSPSPPCLKCQVTQRGSSSWCKCFKRNLSQCCLLLFSGPTPSIHPSIWFNTHKLTDPLCITVDKHVPAHSKWRRSVCMCMSMAPGGQMVL